MNPCADLRRRITDVLFGSIAQSDPQSELLHNGLFLFAHMHLIERLHMVVAQQMENAVNGQISRLSLEAVTVQVCLLHRFFNREDDERLSRRPCCDTGR